MYTYTYCDMYTYTYIYMYTHIWHVSHCLRVTSTLRSHRAQPIPCFSPGRRASASRGSFRRARRALVAAFDLQIPLDEQYRTAGMGTPQGNPLGMS